MITAWQTDNDRFASSDDVVPWWSVTKTVIAVACMRLAEQGGLDLDARLKGRGYSIADLLAHRAGVPSYTSWAEYQTAVRAGNTAWSDAEVLERADAQEPDFKVGQGWSYSNTGYLLVRRLLEEVCDASIDVVLRDLVFDPLALTSVRVAQDIADLDGCRWLDGVGYDPNWVYHGLAIGSAADACVFMHAVGAGDFLKPQSLRRMKASIILGGPIEGRPWTRAAYGLGVMAGDMVDVGTTFGHSGQGPQSVAAVYTMPTKNGPMTAAAFSDDVTEDVVEWRVQQMGMQHG